ncbi:hypothetical protein JTB14_023630 [Gonioctena quinquepunctata]|nr:hypothetical protein JTB14_023630 [Gonioctena quinquepunctata]
MVHVPKANRTKWQKKLKRTILIGFGENTKGYRVYDPEVGSVSTSRDVIIEKAEEVPITKNSEPVGDNDTTEVIISEDTDTGSESEYSSVRNDEEEIQTSDTDFLPEITLRDQTMDETIEAIRRSSRVPKPKSFEDFVTYNCMSGDVNVDPANVDEALSGSEKEQWRQAMKEEYQFFMDNEAWEITEVPDGANVVDCKWVYKNIDGSVSHDFIGNETDETVHVLTFDLAMIEKRKQEFRGGIENDECLKVVRDFKLETAEYRQWPGKPH